MANKIDPYRVLVEKALKKNGTYSRGLTFQIKALASALLTLDLANAEIDSLEVTTVWEETRYGKKLAPHPVFKIQRDAQDSISRQLKQLGLTAEALNVGDDDKDPLVEISKKISNIK